MVRRIRRCLCRSHGQAQKEIMILGQRGDGFMHGLFILFCNLDQIRKQFACEDECGGRAAAMQLISHM